MSPVQTTSLGSLAAGTHLCAFHSDPGQLTRIAATFIGQGLAAGDRVLYVTTDGRADEVLAELPACTGGALSSEQLVVRSFAAVYGTRRPDDLDAVADGFRAAAAEARDLGFPALRVAAQMDGLMDLLGSEEDVVRWERMCTGLQHEIGVSSVCLYDAAALGPEQMARVAGEHAGLAPEAGESPLARFLATDEPWGIRIEGEVDMSNRDLLHAMLVARTAVAPQLRLDLKGLTFTDVGTLSALTTLAAALPGHGWLALHDVPAIVRRILDVTGLHHERLRVES